jgi:hypothetical protein
VNTSISIKDLVRFETGEDGTSISLIAEDDTGRPLRLTFSTTVLSSLVMTLPQIVTAAVQRQRDDPSARVVYPLAESRVELGTDFATRILTLMTLDGFTVSFAVTGEQFRELARSDARLANLKTRRAN